MKTTLTILLLAFALVGCSEKIKPDVVSDAKITWVEGETNAQLCVFLGNGQTNYFQTNIPVASLDAALSAANQYGWKFVSSEHDQYSETYHVQHADKEHSDLLLIADFHP